MKVLKKIGDFFVAMVPFWIFYGVNLLVSIVLSIAFMVIKICNGSDYLTDPTKILTGNELLIISVIVNAVCFIGGIAEMKISKINFSAFRPIKQNGKTALLTFVFTIGMFFVLQEINSLFLQLVNISEADPFQDLLSGSLVLTFLISLSAPFVEELVFRGLMVHEFNKRFPAWFSISAITIVFMLMHSTNMKCYALLFGLTLMLIRYKFGDTLLCFIFHFTANLLSCLLIVFSENITDTVFYITVGSGFVVAVLAFIGMLKTANKKEENKEITVTE